MELKKYQAEVLADLSDYIDVLNEQNNLSKAYSLFWAKKGVSVHNEGEGYLHPYDNSVKNVPRITIKVPTAGGKTYIACNALKPIFDKLPSHKPKVVAWFVPSDTILKQTYEKLNDPTHPYRQRLDSLFNGNVRIVDKDAALFGTGINPTEIREQLTIFILSVQSFATKTKEGRRVYRENEKLTDYVRLYDSLTKRVEGADETAFIQVLSYLNPVIIIDESHNFVADLRVDMLNNINPRFILELTATPKPNSNIISFVDAYKLKEEHMVKLPVIAYNNRTKEDVISKAIELRNSLERKAKEQEDAGGRYIRPIVLFQAQPKTDNDSETFEKIRAALIEAGINKDQVKIKTADKDELKHLDLMSKDCPVRYIITINALKEGWDCPFAYILASVANRSSRVDVEQILGRVLRLPYTTENNINLLNYSYVFTNSDNFSETIQRIIEGLNKSGYSKKDFRVSYNTIDEDEEQPQLSEGLFDQAEESATIEPIEEGSQEEDINVDTIKQSAMNANSDSLTQMEDAASSVGEQYDADMKNAKADNDDIPNDIKEMQKYYSIKPIFEKAVKDLKLPLFVKKVEASNIFDNHQDVSIPITKKMLAEGFDLSKADKNISFTRTAAEAQVIDLSKEDEYTPKSFNLTGIELQDFRSYFVKLSPEAKRSSLAGVIARGLKYDEISEKNIKKFIQDIIKDINEEELCDLSVYQLDTQKRIKEHIDKLLIEYEQQQFKDMIDLGKIICEPTYAFPKRMTYTDIAIGLSKGLYKEEDKDMNDFEYKVIRDISNLENVLFWHRNSVRKNGFAINGFINHYPDFIVGLKSGRIILVETKGDDRDNSDSLKKLELGSIWASKAGDKFRYYMAFENNQLPNAVSVAQLLEKLKEL